MERSEVVKTQQIASLYIHIEQAICCTCVKEFDMLSGVMPASVAASAGQSVD